MMVDSDAIVSYTFPGGFQVDQELLVCGLSLGSAKI